MAVCNIVLMFWNYITKASVNLPNIVKKNSVQQFLWIKFGVLATRWLNLFVNLLFFCSPCQQETRQLTTRQREITQKEFLINPDTIEMFSLSAGCFERICRTLTQWFWRSHFVISYCGGCKNKLRLTLITVCTFRQKRAVKSYKSVKW